MKRNRQIDGLRGLTICLIVIFHLFCRYKEIYFGYTVQYLKWMGDFGNSIFLLISSYYLLGKYEKKIDLKKFYLKKILRLWPCYAIAITITMIITRFFILPGRTCSWKDYMLNLFFLNGFLGRPYVDGAHWYITTLLGATIIIGLIKYFKISEYMLTYLCWIFLEGLTGVLKITILNQLLGSSYVAIICIGISLRIMYQNKYKVESLFQFETRGYQYINCNKWLILCIMCCIYHLMRRGINSVVCLLFALVLFVLAQRQRIVVLNNAILQFLGKISYPFYLIHQNIAYVIEYYMSTKFQFLSFNVIACEAFLITLIIAIILYYVVEKPIQNRIKLRTSRNF